jgi:acetyltransferase-like isoleucine patch superfamily enzyme
LQELEALVTRLGEEQAAAADRLREDLAGIVTGPRVFGPRHRLRIAPTAQVHNALFNTVSGHVTVADQAFFGHDVAVLTGTHDIERTGEQRQLAIPTSGRDVEIGEGAWIASRAVVLGPCRIGSHAVVAAGAVVTGDVPARGVVAGVPARLVRELRRLR